MTTILTDMRYGVRVLCRQPLFTMVALLTLTIGIGANITIFCFVNAFLLRPLPYSDAERLVRLRPMSQSFGGMSASYANYLDWQRLNQSFETIACYRYQDLNLTGVAEAERLKALQVSANLLPMLGTQPLLGRLFDPSDDRGQAAPTTILSYGLWQRRFGGNPDILGKPMLLDGEPHTIVGVLPPDLQFPALRQSIVDVWLPVGLLEKHDWFTRRANHAGLSGLGKLKSGVTIAQAQVDMERVARQLTQDYPNENAGYAVRLRDYHEALVREIRPGILVLMTAVGCVLLIVCVNITGLLLVRAVARNQEFSVRCALGAGRLRIIRQLLCENLILAILGGIAGIAVAQWGVHLLAVLLGNNFGFSDARPPLLDRNMLLFSLGITLGTGLLLGLFPALQSSLVTVTTALRGGTRTATAGRGHHRVRDVLVVAEVAIALVLLTGAGLLIRSFQHYLKTDPGYNPESTLTMQLSLPGKVYDSDAKKFAFYRELLERVEPLSGIRYAGLCSNLLGNWQSTYCVEGAPIAEPGQARHAEFCNTSPAYFDALGVRLLAGRRFTQRDTEDASPVAIVDESFVQRCWPNEDPLGKRLQFGTRPDPNGTWYSVIGVVSHVKPYGIDQISRESVYLSAYQKSFDYPTLVVRTEGDPMQVLGPIRRAIAKIDPDLAPSDIRTLQAIADEQSFVRRFITTILGIFAGTALLLSALGIYGVTAYAVSQRTQEFGIRMALGACWGDIVGLVLGRSGRLIFVGITLGLLASLSLSGLIRGLLFDVTAWDPVTFVAVTLLLATVVLLACLIPARRAAKIDPMEALRYE